MKKTELIKELNNVCTSNIEIYLGDECVDMIDWLFDKDTDSIIDITDWIFETYKDIRETNMNYGGSVVLSFDGWPDGSKVIKVKNEINNHIEMLYTQRLEEYKTEKEERSRFMVNKVIMNLGN